MATKRKQYPSQARLRELFDYDPEGFLVWRWRDDVPRNTNDRFAGEEIGKPYVEPDGTVRRSVYIDGVRYKAQDIFWIFLNGKIPDGSVVRINDIFGKITAKNIRLDNTKKATQNSGTLRGRSKSSKYIGVTKGYGNTFVAEARIGGRAGEGVYIGRYTTEIAAAAAYDDFCKKNRPPGWHCNGVDFPDFENYRTRGRKKQTRQESGSSGHKGVRKNGRKWGACIHISGGNVWLGTHDTKEQAARAYNIAAYDRYGEHAILNDIPDPLGKLQADEGDVF